MDDQTRLAETFPPGEPLALPDEGLFARRLRAFAEERGL